MCFDSCSTGTVEKKLFWNKKEGKCIQQGLKLLGWQAFSWSFTQTFLPAELWGSSLVCTNQRDPWARDRLVCNLSLWTEGQSERGKGERACPWELTSHCGLVVRAGRKQVCGSLILWPGCEEDTHSMSWVGSQEKRWSGLTFASTRASLLWASMLGMFHRTVWTKTAQACFLLLHFSGVALWFVFYKLKAKRLQFPLLQYSLYWGGLDLNP